MRTHHTRVFSALIGAFVFLLSAKPSVPFQGAREAGLANAIPNTNSTYNSFYNPAGFAGTSYLAVGISYNNLYQLKELSTRSVVACMPTKRGGFGGGWSYFGASTYNIQHFSAGYGHRLHHKIDAGILINYRLTELPEQYENDYAIFGNIGMIFHPNTSLDIGIHLQNISNSKYNHYNTEEIPMSLNAGINWKSESFLIGSSLSLYESEKALIRVGAEFNLAKNFAVRAGVSNKEYLQYTFGLGYRQKRWQSDIAFAYHNQLGMASFVSFEFFIGESRK